MVVMDIVTEDIAGLRSSLSFKCLKPDCGNTYKLNSQPDGETVNTRFEMAMFSIGRNRQQAVRLLGEMNMPPPVSCTMWNRNKEKIYQASHTVAEETMTRAAKHVLKAIKPVFEKLSDDDLLRKCARGGTQNANESLHNMIWTRCPKTVFVGRTRLEIAVSVFNEGERSRLKVFQLLGLKCGNNMVEMMQSVDRKRVTSAISQSTKTAKQQRRKKRVSKAPEKDSTYQYQTGAF